MGKNPKIVHKVNTAKESGGYVLVDFDAVPWMVMHESYYKQLLELLSYAEATRGVVTERQLRLAPALDKEKIPDTKKISRQLYHRAKMKQLLKCEEA